MSNPILVVYASRYGSTQEVAEAVTTGLRDRGLTVKLQPMVETKSLAGCDAVVMGAPLFMFHWHDDAHRFLSRHRQALAERPAAVFALGPVHEPHDEQEWQSSREQLEAELAKYSWFEPVACEMFGGKYSPEKLRFPLNLFAGKEPASDLRDWAAIKTWAQSLTSKLVVSEP